MANVAIAQIAAARPPVVPSLSPRSWTGPALVLDWFWTGSGLVLGWSWAGPGVALDWSSLHHDC